MNQAIRKAAIERFAHQGYLEEAEARALTMPGSSTMESGLKSLLVRGVIPEAGFAETMAVLFRCSVIPRADLPTSTIPQLQSVSAFLLEHEALPLSLNDDTLCIAMSDPSDEFTLQVLRAKFALKVEPCVAVRSELIAVLTSLYADSSSAKSVNNSAVDFPDDLETDSSLVRDVHRLLQRAVSAGASDLHFEPSEEGLSVRLRVHGVLQSAHQFNSSQSAQVIARIKLMAKLDVTERRQAQSGRFKFPADGRVIDFRVSTLPLHDGESVVLRLLEFQLSQSSLSELGLGNEIAQAMERVVSAQQGMVLVTGPTGSGKSTTLYALLNQLNSPERKLISIEDPVELNVPGVNQIQVDDEHGIGFSQALRSVLRQDPDVIMVGEIRDSDTAQLAAQAALTGHLVLCTLHTASAAAAVTRLHNLGLPEYLIAATLKGVLAQRLLRKLCVQCRDTASSEACAKCNGTGYVRRTTIAEFLPAEAFERVGIDEPKLKNELLNKQSLRKNAQQLVAQDVTDEAEVYRVLGLV